METKVVEGGFFVVVALVGSLVCFTPFANLYFMPIHKLYCYIMVSHYRLLAEHH